jgi:hypothetical protein
MANDYTKLKWPIVADSYLGSHEAQVVVDGVTTDFSYDHIPYYQDPNSGETIKLNEVIDFRPIRVGKWKTCQGCSDTEEQDQSSSFPYNKFGKVLGSWYPRVGEEISTYYEHYLGRKDKVVLTCDREFEIVYGEPSINPVPPADPDCGMVLYNLDTNPYTYNEEDVSVSAVENKRYTMRDIGALEDRIVNLEEHMQLSLVEEEANAKAAALSPSLGDTFTNGIIADTFESHNIGDVSNQDYNVGVDVLAGG